TTRIGGGPMPTELKDECGHLIRERGREYGTTTGRPRRCGWFDAVAGRYSVRVNGFTDICITLLDVLDTFPTIKVCTAYRLGGKLIERFPSSATVLERCEPVYEELPGWEACLNDIRTFEDLPKQARAYLKRLEDLLGCRISIVSVGPDRPQMITIRDVM
ncbi:MAG: adenylosuccinate synthetase, partial [Chloroflexi bacterium]|nr:adenylosuccinate synthetase [Chloroflexota bacterium]